VINGQHSEYLTNPSVKEIEKKGKDGLLNVYRDAISTECDIHYAGKLTVDKVKNLIVNYFEPQKVTQKADKCIDLPLQRYDKPTVFVIDNPTAKQSVIYGYTFTATELDNDFMNASKLFNTYFGAGMTSIMFQEIREFRSFAYGAQSRYVRPAFVNKNNGSYLLCNLSTQSDKTIDALFVLDSLLKDMPVRQDKLLNDKKQLRNDIGNSYPSFRNLSPQIANIKRIGYKEDTNNILLNGLDKIDMNTVIDFYNKNIKSKTTCYIVAGNMKQIDIEKLKQFGEVKIIKTKEIFK
jgi:predicted Zn-dependent peptidase